MVKFNKCRYTWPKADNPGTFLPPMEIYLRDQKLLPQLWNPVAWNTVDQKQNTPDIKNIIQEIVNRSGWVSGNALSILITGSSGTREAESWDGEAAAAPRLYITYTPPSEICNNGIDDDGDGFTDCLDSDCAITGIPYARRP
ncbi:MAG: hypothetical protein IPN49_16515 [Saprospiraceae bacterium]|nr:hypothetical protein [Saprospiraceae bacterium]